MLVKELRQGLRTRLFTSLLIGFQGLLLLFLAFESMIGRRAGSGPGLFWLAVGGGLLVLQPLRACTALSSEFRDGTSDLLVLTPLSSFRIVWAKYLSLISQTLLLAITVLPYLVMRYFLGGISLPREACILALLLWFSLIATALQLISSGLRSVLLRFLICGGLAFLLSSVAVGMAQLAAPTFFDPLEELLRAPLSVRIPTFSTLLLLPPALIYLLLGIASTRIAPPSENTATRPRLFALGLQLLLGIGAAACIYLSWRAVNTAYATSPPTPNSYWMAGRNASEEYMIPLAFIFAISSTIAVFTVLGSITENPLTSPRILKSFVRRGRSGLLAAAFLAPGWPSGVLLYFILAAVPVGSMIGIVGTDFYFKALQPRLYGSRSNFDEEEIFLLIVLSTAILCPLVFSRLWCRLFRRPPGDLLSLYLYITIGCVAFAFFVGALSAAARSLSLIGIITPISAPVCLIHFTFGSRSANTPVVILGSFIALLYVLAALVSAVRQIRSTWPALIAEARESEKAAPGKQLGTQAPQET